MKSKIRSALLAVCATLLAASSVASANETASVSEKTFVCSKVSAPSEKLVFTAAGETIHFSQWKSSFGLCEMDLKNSLPFQYLKERKVPEHYRPNLKGVSYAVNYTWYYTTQYYLTFEQPVSKVVPGSLVRLEMNGDDDDGCFIHHEEFTCQVKAGGPSPADITENQ